MKALLSNRQCVLALIAVFTGYMFSAINSNIAYAADKGTSVDWPNWHGPHHNGISSETGWQTHWPEDGPKILWKKSIGTGFASIAVSRGRIYAMGNTGKKGDKKEKEHKDIIYCLNAHTGREIWRKSYLCPVFPKQHEGGPGATPTVDGDFVYTLSKKGDLYCLNAETGQVIWYKNLAEELGVKLPNWYFAGSPLIMGELLILNAGTAGMAIEKHSGRVVWQNGKGATGYATPVPYNMDGQDCVALLNISSIVGLKPDNGQKLWQIDWTTRYDENSTDPIVHGDYIFISTGNNEGCALFRIEDGKPRKLWKNRAMSNQFNNSVLWNGFLYGFDRSKLKCLEFQTGVVKWTKDGLGMGSLMCADGKLIILSEKGMLIIAQADPEKFEAVSQAQILKGKCWTVPVLSGGHIYARNARGDLVCVDVSGKVEDEE